jgi:hypothetical protein
MKIILFWNVQQKTMNENLNPSILVTIKDGKCVYK